jgi:hypothetical protein
VHHRLLASSGPLVVHTRQFEYAGELRRAGGMRLLSSHVPQVALPSGLMEQVWKDIDTKHRLVMLMTLVEDCVLHLVATTTTLSSSSSSGVDDDGSNSSDGVTTTTSQQEVLLERYVLDVLLVDARRWRDVACGAALSQQVRVKHLQSLYMGLEERLGDPLEAVALAYRGRFKCSRRCGVGGVYVL